MNFFEVELDYIFRKIEGEKFILIIPAINTACADIN